MRRPDRRPKIISTRTTRRARVGREPGRASSHHVTHLVNGERGETELPVPFREPARGGTGPTAPIGRSHCRNTKKVKTRSVYHTGSVSTSYKAQNSNIPGVSLTLECVAYLLRTYSRESSPAACVMRMPAHSRSPESHRMCVKTETPLGPLLARPRSAAPAPAPAPSF